MAVKILPFLTGVRGRMTPLRPTPRRFAVAALALLVLIWGYNWVVMKVGVRYSSPFEFAALRAMLGAVSMFGVMVFLRRPLRPRALAWTCLLGLLQTSGMMGFSMWALVSGAAGRTAVLVYAMPFWAMLIAWPVLGERIKGTQWLAVALALAGLLVIVEPFGLKGTVAANVLALAAGLSWGAGNIVAKSITRSLPDDLLSVSAWQMFFGAIPLGVVALALPSSSTTWSLPFIGALLFNVVPASALALPLWFFVLKVLPAGTAGIGVMAVPVVGILSAYLQLGERPPYLEALGMLLILGALAVLTVRGLRAGEGR